MYVYPLNPELTNFYLYITIISPSIRWLLVLYYDIMFVCSPLLYRRAAVYRQMGTPLKSTKKSSFFSDSEEVSVLILFQVEDRVSHAEQARS